MSGHLLKKRTFVFVKKMCSWVHLLSDEIMSSSNKYFIQICQAINLLVWSVSGAYASWPIRIHCSSNLVCSTMIVSQIFAFS